jgi:2-keto-4-pentenoate hydratase/2-oxohepta-3-ene-1,7-dioic acid hydratase in catechol pathway
VEVGKILAIGRNYADHVAEMNGPKAGPPVLFFKPASAVIHHGEAIVVPAGAGELHHEVELVAVIGAQGKRIREEDALSHVLGFAVGLDMTLRDIQAEAKKKGTPWALAKGFDSSAPISRVMPREQVGDGSGLAIRLMVNGEERQSSVGPVSPGDTLTAEIEKIGTLTVQVRAE